VVTGGGRGRGQGRHAAGSRPRDDAGDRTTESAQFEAPTAGLPSQPDEPGAGSDAPTAQFTASTEPVEPETTDGPDAEKPVTTGKKRKKLWRELVIIVVAAAVLTLLVKAFVVQVYRIPSQSMENTLLVGDRVLVNKVVYRFRGIDRGDVVVFSGQGSWGPDAPPPSSDPIVRVFDDILSGLGLHSSQTYYIKRVIGLPGDHVACCTNGKVTVNGVPLTETSFLPPGAVPSTSSFSVVVPPGRIWVMGDNREDSDDSRSHMVEGFPGQGTIPKNEVVGRAFLVIWPISRFNDLPIPNTFQQAALHSGAAGATVIRVGGGALDLGGRALGVVAAAPVAGTAGAAGIISAPLLLLRRRRRAAISSKRKGERGDEG
jgi:signal peptidase I